MADPLSVLHKGARPPLPGIVPVRQPQSQERALFDQITRGGVTSSDVVADALKKQQQKPLTEKVSDDSLLSSLMKRVAVLERSLEAANTELKSKDLKIKQLHDKLRGLEAAESNTPALHHQFKALQKRQHDMERFLADYGMIWVGTGDEDDDSDDVASSYNQPTNTVATSTHESASSLPAAPKTWNQARSIPGPVVVDYDKIISNVKELNALAGEGTATVAVHKDGSRRLNEVESVQLTLYKNGLLMFQGPFRPYSDPTTQMLVKDLVDGFFPWELHERYPHGVPFVLTDKRNDEYKQREVFHGVGFALGGDAKPSKLLEGSSTTPECAQIHTLQTQQQQGAVVSSDKFLSRLPASVIKNGNIIDIRAGVAELINPPQAVSKVTLVETDVVQELQHWSDNNSNERPQTPADIASLQIKSETGKHTYVVKLRFTATVGDIHKCIDRQRGPSPKYVLITAFPRKVLEDPSETLIDAGLTPNATLRMKLA